MKDTLGFASQAGSSPQPPLLRSAFQVGALSGIAGAVLGGTAGIVRSSTPALFAAASGIQCFALGSIFWASRGSALNSRTPGTVTQKEKIYASALGGGFSGGLVAALFRGRRNIAPGIVVMAVLGAAGQTAYNTIDSKEPFQPDTSDARPSPNLLQRIGKSRWSPMKVLSDEEYEDMLQDKLLRVKAEIAILDEHIGNLKRAANGSSLQSSEMQP